MQAGSSRGRLWAGFERGRCADKRAIPGAGAARTLQSYFYNPTLKNRRAGSTGNSKTPRGLRGGYRIEVRIYRFL
jgi:hypothetical protein